MKRREIDYRKSKTDYWFLGRPGSLFMEEQEASSSFMVLLIGYYKQFITCKQLIMCGINCIHHYAYLNIKKMRIDVDKFFLELFNI